MLRDLSEDDIKSLINSETTPIREIQKFPCHTQAVERCIKLVTEASNKACGHEARDGYIRATLKSRSIMPNFSKKSDFKCVVDIKKKKWYDDGWRWSASIESGSRKFQHRVYVADITDSCILGLDFVQKFKFTVDLEKNEIRTGLEKISLFSSSTQHRKRTSDGKNVLTRRLCFEGCEPCSNAKKKFKKETDISVEALTMTTENRWSLSEIQKAQLEDPDIRPILKMKLNSADRPSWQEIARKSPATK
ncbi:hypothetical protein AVEN_228689-1 [Araneus ventricosus]|uniref:Uncharacterized protein n=1 Tax=Araneus ventricosus TaxID=182803 RepID=A0A4Y2P5Z8_ARAVE|nr:hypothetical protein AVEN_228689-1 [Araneus ventricosus]